MWWEILIGIILIILLVLILILIYQWHLIVYYYNKFKQQNWDQLNFKTNRKFFFFWKNIEDLNSEVQPISIVTKLKKNYKTNWKDIKFKIKYMNQVDNTLIVQELLPTKTKELELFDKFYIPFIYANVLNKQPFSYIIFYSQEETYKSLVNFLTQHDIDIYKISHNAKQIKKEYWLEGNYFNLLKIIWDKYHSKKPYRTDIKNLINQLTVVLTNFDDLDIFKRMIESIIEYMLQTKESLSDFNFATILETWRLIVKGDDPELSNLNSLNWVFELSPLDTNGVNKNINLFNKYFKTLQEINDFNYKFEYDEINFDSFHTKQSVIFLKSDQWMFFPIKESLNPQPMNIAIAKQLISYKSTMEVDTLKTMVFIPDSKIYMQWNNFDSYVMKSKIDKVNYFLKISDWSSFFMSFTNKDNSTLNLMAQTEIFPHLYVFDNSSIDKRIIESKVLDNFKVARDSTSIISKIRRGFEFSDKDIILNGDHLYKFKNSIFLHERLDYIGQWNQLLFGNNSPYQKKHLLRTPIFNNNYQTNDFTESAKELEIANSTIRSQIIVTKEQKNTLINEIFEFIKMNANLKGVERNRLKVDIEQLSLNEITYEKIEQILKQHNVSDKNITKLIDILISKYVNLEEE